MPKQRPPIAYMLAVAALFFSACQPGSTVAPTALPTSLPPTAAPAVPRPRCYCNDRCYHSDRCYRSDRRCANRRRRAKDRGQPDHSLCRGTRHR